MRKFKKTFIFILLFFVLLNGNSNSEIVKKVEIKGNKRISLETIMVFGDVSVGKDYNITDVNSLIKKLYSTSFFSEISASIKNNTLIITVEENPIIRSIIYDGEKAKKYMEKISEILSLKENSPFVENGIKSDINLIREFYRSLGFYFAKIDVEILTLEKNRVDVRYKINKGEKAKITKIYFLGDKKIREKKLRDVITSQEAQFWKIISRNVYLSKQRIELDKRLLKNYYRNKGYYEVDVKSTNVEYAEGEGFVLTYNINAGTRYKFNKIFANISESLDKEAFLSLEDKFSKLAGQYYSQRKLQSVLEEIDKLSEQKELQFINHNIEETLGDTGIEVKINIFEGEKVIIERINIVGNSVTNDSVIRSALIVDEGDPFSTLLVNKSINEIKARNIFSKVEYDVTAGSSPDLKVIEISVQEKATGEIVAGAGVGTDGTSFMFSIKENNWLGRGVQLESTLNLSQEKISGNISVNNPNYNYSGNSAYASLDVSSTDRSNSSGFKSSKTGFGIGTSFEQYENFYVSPNLSVAFEDIEVDASASTAVKNMEGNFFNVDLGYSVVKDDRNQRYKPTKGSKILFKQSIPIIQDSSSIVNGFDITSYHSFSEDLVGSLKFHSRAVNGIDTDVRLTERLYIPSTRLRGFNTNKVGPKDGKDYIGGNYVTALGFEAQLPNLLPESYRTDFSLFFDSANIWGVDYTSIDETNTIRSSVGISANIFTTIGPLNFTMAQDLSKASDDQTETFNFRLGTSF
jgi:outer membrane protein insertion porin family